MEALKKILAGKPQITINGETFNLMYSNWVVKDSPLDVNLKLLDEIIKKDIPPEEKMKKFGSIGANAIDLIISGIKTHIVVECDDLQAIDTGMLSEKSSSRLKEVELILRAGTDTYELINLFIFCVQALSDFMPKGEGASPSLLSREKKKN
jgi:hypothetical protein